MRDLASQHVEQSELSPGYRRRAEVHATDWDFRADDWRAELGRVIEAEILPRLLLAHERERGAREHRRGFATRTAAGDAPEPDLDVAEFTERLLGGDEDWAWSYIGAIASQGRPRREILVDILGPSARLLGEMWESDQRDFIEVTVGLRRLAQVLRRLSEEDEALEPGESAPRILLLPTPGENHDFGVAMVETFFRAEGWRVSRGGANYAELLRDEWFDAIGFSLSGVRLVDALAAAVRRARAASRNPALRVLVGGDIFARDPDLPARVGADAAAPDAATAIHLAESLLRGRAIV